MVDKMLQQSNFINLLENFIVFRKIKKHQIFILFVIFESYTCTRTTVR